MKRQDGYLTRQSGSWLGHYSNWILDHSTGQRKRLQRAFKIGPASLSKTEAREKLRQRIVQEIGIPADSRVTVRWFVEQRWKPLHEGGWRESTKQTNEELLKILLSRFGNAPIEDVDSVQIARMAQLAGKAAVWFRRQAPQNLRARDLGVSPALLVKRSKSNAKLRAFARGTLRV